MVGRWISFWDGFFSRVMLVSGRVHESHEHEHCLSYCPIFSCSLYSHQSVTRAAEFPGCARFGSTTLCTLKNKRCRSARNFLWTPHAKAENTRIRFKIHRKQTTCNSKSIPSLCMTMTLQQALNIPWCSHLTYPIRIAKKTQWNQGWAEKYMFCWIENLHKNLDPFLSGREHFPPFFGDKKHLCLGFLSSLKNPPINLWIEPSFACKSYITSSGKNDMYHIIWYIYTYIHSYSKILRFSYFSLIILFHFHPSSTNSRTTPS